MTEKVLYAELTPKEFQERIAVAPIAYLPLGTLEWHGEHLPLGADGLQSQGFFEHLARESGGIVLPMLFLGPCRVVEEEDRTLYGMDIGCEHLPGKRRYPSQQLPGSAYWVPDETFKILIEAILKQLRRAGFRIVVAHGHGPSTKCFRAHIDEWKGKFDLVCFHCRDDEHSREGLGIQSDHAGANETSLMMALRPDLVQMENLPTDLDERLLGVAGKDPRVHASAELGNKAIAFQTERMGRILREALERL